MSARGWDDDADVPPPAEDEPLIDQDEDPIAAQDDDPLTIETDEPGLDLYLDESEWESAWDDAEDDPYGALPEVDRLVGRMLLENGYELGARSEVAGEDPEVVATYREAHRVALLAGAGDDVDPGDLADALEALRAIHDSLRTDPGGA